jgi:hypothetical protein
MRKTPLRLALPVSAVIWSAIFGVAQAPKPGPDTANATIKTTTPTITRDTRLTPPPGKMRGFTNEMRWAAATRANDRKAHAQVKGGKSPVQKGGKQ